ncbi:MAG: hypothetical protein AAGL10_07595 [Pseudomonadota bacterium]
MINRIAAGWQLILADLALILFLVTLAALASALQAQVDSKDASIPLTASAQSDRTADTAAPVQALYRPAVGIAPFGEWLSDQPNDPRAQLTIIASYSAQANPETWRRVRAMVSQAAERGIAAKVIITPGTFDDVYASFAYDRPTGSNAGEQPAE